MALNIKDPEPDRLARELAALPGESITVALRRAIEARLRVEQRRLATGADLSDIIRRGRMRSTIDHRTETEILGLGEDGLPQ